MPRGSDDSRSDRELIDACNHAEARLAADSFAALYRRHRDYVLRVAMRFTHDGDLATDVLQETFTYFLKQFPPTGSGFTLGSRLTTYLYPVAKNFAISAVRKNARFANADLEPDELPAAADPPSTGDELDAALAGLTAEHREVLLLRFVDGMSLQEVADALEIPVGTVKSRVHLAIKALRRDPRIRDLFDQ